MNSSTIRLTFLLLLCGRSVCWAEPHAIGTRPNVIMILADDLAVGDLCMNNGGRSRTPNIDRLASQGVRFQQAYSASPVCAPARAALLTGRYPHRTGVVTLNMNRFPELTRMRLDEVTIADALRAAGYATGLIGKWHCGIGESYHPNRRGFDEFEGFSGSQDISYFRYRLDINGESHLVDDDYLTDDLSRRAIAFVRRHQHEPFFLHLAHYAPHRPLDAPADLVKSYSDQGLGESTAKIYAMIEVMDRGIGELLDELDRLKLDKRTVVIFASDNGPDPLTGTRFNQDLRGMKYEIYEGGIRVPLFVCWRSTLTPGDRRTSIHFVDLVPTILDLCDVDHESKLPMDGVSFKQVLAAAGKHDSPHRHWQWNRGQPNYTHNAALRDGDWKLVRPYVNRKSNPANSDQKPVLYNLAEDPFEETDLSQQHLQRYTRMLDELERWTHEVETDRQR